MSRIVAEKEDNLQAAKLVRVCLSIPCSFWRQSTYLSVVCVNYLPYQPTSHGRKVRSSTFIF